MSLEMTSFTQLNMILTKQMIYMVICFIVMEGEIIDGHGGAY
ncbi:MULTISPECIES: hypothetical protein [Bacillaceae]|nr:MULTISPECIES: hypothetical protein [Bacillaceae]